MILSFMNINYYQLAEKQNLAHRIFPLVDPSIKAIATTQIYWGKETDIISKEEE